MRGDSAADARMHNPQTDISPGAYQSSARMAAGSRAAAIFLTKKLACGERALGAHFKPDADLHLEIKLLEVLTRDDGSAPFRCDCLFARKKPCSVRVMIGI
jgi:hypothetical protein